MNAITLFAGAGGADLGMQRAGVRHLACVEGNANACATLRAAGFPAIQSWIGDAGPLVPRWRWGGGPVDLLWASPPCQPYSAFGLRLGAEDERDGWPATREAAVQIRPQWMVVENVAGAPIEQWAADLAGLFRFISCAVMDAADWGLPSRRTRRFLVAGPEPYRWPEPTHGDGRIPWVGFGDALELLPSQDAIWDAAGEVLADDEAEDDAWHFKREALANDMWARRHEWLGDAGTKPELAILPSAAVTATEEKGATCPDKERGRSNPINRASDSLFLATGRRRLTWQECAVLLGFPPDYPFAGGIGAKYRQIGNAVAPVMAEALVSALPPGAR